ncbi:S8 family peptidase [Microbacterium algeriense]|uniref:S8 family serine peptidase n=1 Tax=Microbacterium algeriense TaxID=2615184 RepID=A0ABQ6V7Z5_9MICO|nr:S8 family serine peptidase [Microbacterium algeriense]KAB1866333.1 S8 family serine peptidase [Microbacterium algeriense]
MTRRTIVRSTCAVLAVGAVLGLSAPLTALPAAAAPAEGEAALNWVVNTAPGRTSTDTVAAAIADAGGTMLISYPEIGVTVARAPEGGFGAELRKLSWVQSVGPTRTATTPDVLPEPGDSAAGATTEPASMPAEGTAWDTVAIGATTASGKGVVVGIADSGVDAGHPDLADRIDPSLSVGCGVNGVPDTRPEAWRPGAGLGGAHGTHVAGSVAGAANGSGIRGVAPEARVAAIKVDNQSGFIYPEASICATMWAAQHRIPIVNHSYFVDPWYLWCADADTQAAALEALRRAYAYSREQGVLNVAAVGNEGQDLAAVTTDVMSPDDGEAQPRPVTSSCLQAPAGLPDVISVAAVDQDETTGALIRAGFSNFGVGKVTVAAPGIVWSAVPRQADGSIYASFPGTSMASPHVAGLAARILSEDPALTPEGVTRRITETADPLSGAGSDLVGAGLLDAGTGTPAPAVGVYSRIALTGQPFRVSGSGHPANSTVELRIGALTQRVQTDDAGRFATVFDVPDDAPIGAATLVAGSASAPIVIRASPAAPTVLTPRPDSTTYANSTRITGTGVPGTLVRVRVADGELTPYLRFIRVGEDGRWTATAPLPQGRYQVTARTVAGEDASALTAPVPFAVHTASALSYSVQISPQSGPQDDTLVRVDLTNAGASAGAGTVDIDLSAYEHFPLPTPSVGEIERTDRGLRWTLTLDSTQKAQLQIPVRAGTDDPPFPVITVK